MSSADEPGRARVLAKAEAHQLLDEVRAGVPHPKHDIVRALAATGDLRGWWALLPDVEKAAA